MDNHNVIDKGFMIELFAGKGNYQQIENKMLQQKKIVGGL